MTFTSRTTSAPWAARRAHTTVIDAAGAIYVIGGFDGTNYFKDVWVSTDGGADWTGAVARGSTALRAHRGTKGVLEEYSQGTTGVLRCTIRALGVLEGRPKQGYTWGTRCRGVLGVL